MSNFYPQKTPIFISTKVDDFPIYCDQTVVFETSEHAFMARKALEFGDLESYEDIKNTLQPQSAKAIGRQVKGYDDDKWAEVRYKHMYDACMGKFDGTELQEDLMNTGNRILVEASPYDKVWGVGLGENDPKIEDEANWKGLNLLGKVLMDVRQELRERNY